MTLLDRHISRAVLLGTGITAVIFISLFSFMFFVAELQYVEGHYTAVKAAQYSLLTNTRMLRDLFPMLSLIGSLLGLGMLANNNELTVMRSAGVSILRITWSVMKVGLWMMLFMALFSEVVVPVAEQTAKQLRATALNQKVFVGGNAGLWMRDGDNYINARTVKSNHSLENVSIYSLDDAGRLLRSLQAASARYGKEGWMLYQVRETDFSQDQVVVSKKPQLAWHTSLQPEIVEVVSIAPIDLSLAELMRVIQHLNVNEQNVQRHEVAFWSKFFAPFSTGLMIFLAVPFVFGSLRSVPISQRLLSGILVGMLFYLLNQGATRFGVVYQLPPVLSAGGPLLLIGLFAWWMFRRVR